jgi:multicomponent Na+:H+ antiporter subunit F
MFAFAAAAITLAMVFSLLRAFYGPTVFDRILAVNVLGTKTVLMIAVIGFLTGRPDFLDLALVYVLINFIATLAALKLFKYGHMGDRRLADGTPVDETPVDEIQGDDS